MSNVLADRNRVVLELMPLVHSTVKALKRPIPAGLTRDDLTQEGTIGLIRAVDTFDSKHGATLETWATHCIQNALREALREASKQVATVPLEACASSLPPVPDETRAVDLRLSIDTSPIPAQSRAILQMFLDEELSKADIAQRLNISRTHAGRLVDRALSELKAVLSDD